MTTGSCLISADEGPMLETLDYTIRIGITVTPTFLYFDLYFYSAYAAHYVYLFYLCILKWCDFKEILNCDIDVN